MATTERVVFPANRIVQLDADLLDHYLIEALRSKVIEVVVQLRKPRWQLICSDVVKFLPAAYYMTRAFMGQSPAQRLLNIRLHHLHRSWSKTTCYYLASFLLPCAVDFVTSTHGFALPWLHHHRQRRLERVVAVLKLLSFAHFFYFLFRGGSAHMLERMLNIQPVYDRKPSLGLINYAMLRRELIGHACGHLFLLLSPLLKLLVGQVGSRLASSSLETTHGANKLNICDSCREDAIHPVTARSSTNGRQTRRHLCHYCFHVELENGDDELKLSLPDK